MNRSLMAILMILVFLQVSGCNKNDENVEAVKKNTIDSYIFVKGGTFTMGDFGRDVEGQHVPYTFMKRDLLKNTPHQVTLDSYSLTRNKVTWFEYDTFLLDTGRPVQYIRLQVNPKGVKPLTSFVWRDDRPTYQLESGTTEQSQFVDYYLHNPASVQWQDAKDYCQWLGRKLNLPIDLVTDAQWEYAARSGGQEVLFANADVDPNRKPLFVDMFSIPRPVTMTSAKPVGTLSTPNHLGFYDMDTNGYEWTNDWFSESYGNDNPQITNPQGPTDGTKKTVRIGELLVFYRYSANMSSFFSFRCALNQPEPLKYQ